MTFFANLATFLSGMVATFLSGMVTTADVAKLIMSVRKSDLMKIAQVSILGMHLKHAPGQFAHTVLWN